MKGRAIVAVLLASCIAFIPVLGLAEESGEKAKDQIQLRDMARDQLRDKLCTTDEAKLQARDRLQEQDRLRTMDSEHACFPDIDGHWARETIRNCYCWELVNGYPEGDFKPDGTATGTEATIMISRFMNCTSGSSFEDGNESDFDWNEIPQWALDNMNEKMALMLVHRNAFYGEEKINRLQFALMLANCLGLEPEELPEGEMIFEDQDDIEDSNMGYVFALQKLGIINGESGNFNPNRFITRAEISQMLMNVLNIIE